MKTDAQRRVDDLLSGTTKPSDVGEISECSECAAARKWIAEKTGIGGGPRPLAFLIASHEQHEREYAAAEERGRRRGLEERDELRAALGRLLEALCIADSDARTREVRAAVASGQAAIAPRDSGKGQP